jgi:hypothetical protein
LVRSIIEIAPVNVSCASGYPLAGRPNPIQQPASAFYRAGLPRSTRERWCLRHHRLCPLLSVYRPSTAKATRRVPDRERVHIFSHLCGAHIRSPQPASTWIVSPRGCVKIAHQFPPTYSCETSARGKIGRGWTTKLPPHAINHN